MFISDRSGGVIGQSGSTLISNASAGVLLDGLRPGGRNGIVSRKKLEQSIEIGLGPASEL